MIYVIAFLVLVALLIIGVPVVYGFGAAVIVLASTIRFSATIAFPTMYDKMASVVLLAIPMFIIAGGVMEKGKIGDALVGFVELFVGKIKGSLAIVAVVTSAVFGSISGSGAATLSCVGSIILPKMRERQYNMGKAAAVICCAAPLGLLIPPSATQIIIAWIGNLSVLACFLSTVIPGITLTILISIVSYFLFRKDRTIVDAAMTARMKKVTLRGEVLPRTKHALPALFMPVMILGSIHGGLMTPTEAAAVTVFYAIPVAVWVYKGTSLRELRNVFVQTATSTGTLMVMIAIMMVVSQILMMQNMPNKLFGVLTTISKNPTIILLMINVFLVLVGMIMDDASGVMLATTLMVPMANKLGVSPYTMSAIIGVNLGMGNITPPTAPFLYMTSSIAKIDSVRIMRHCFTIIFFAYIPTLLLTTYIPWFSTWLPSVVLGIKP